MAENLKIRHPKSGSIFNGAESAKTHFCFKERRTRCNGCPLSRPKNGTLYGCRFFTKFFPREAVERMGYEIIEEAAKNE